MDACKGFESQDTGSWLVLQEGLEHRAKMTHHIMKSQAGWDPKTAYSLLLPASPQVSEDIEEGLETPAGLWKHQQVLAYQVLQSLIRASETIR